MPKFEISEGEPQLGKVDQSFRLGIANIAKKSQTWQG